MPQDDEYFEGFAWPIPLGFADALGTCRFEQGDLLYDTPKAYEGNWVDALLHMSYSIQIEYPLRGISTKKEITEESAFSDNWNQEVVFELANYGKGKKSVITTTQGRLYCFLWKGDFETLRVDSPAPELPYSSLKMTQGLPAASNHLMAEGDLKLKADHIFLMPYDPTLSLLKLKYCEVHKTLSKKFSCTMKMLSPRNLGMESDANFLPTAKVACLFVEGSRTELEDTLKSVFYKPSSDKKTKTERYRLSAHGYLQTQDPPIKEQDRTISINTPPQTRFRVDSEHIATTNASNGAAMKIIGTAIRGFRRLEQVAIELEEDETVFVGPNNSGKTSTAAAFRCFLAGKDFKVYDFSVSKICDIDAYGNGKNTQDLPVIELDLWFSIDPDHISFGRAFTLLPELSDKLEKVGIRLKYQARASEEMRKAYWAAYPESDDGTRSRPMSHYLGTDLNLKKHYEITYYSLDDRGKKTAEMQLTSSHGRSLIRDLVRVDFLDAQRGVNDEETDRGSRLSTAFSTFYEKNLEQAESDESAHHVIDENNRKLTEHYEKHFSGLMKVIRGLGVPSINDRELKIVSSMSPLEALQGNTDILYIDSEHQHELPESYNGLGFKNLIYMAIKISHVHLQWMRTEENRPLCQLIFVEEPEVHLHAQIQQTFIKNIWSIISNAAKAVGGEDAIPQFVVSTHSSHILDTIDFEKVRYFERCELEGEDRHKVSTLNASKVHSLRSFHPEPVEVDGKKLASEEIKRFLLRYLKLTHCDLFFADAAILVEGTVEKLLLPKMLEKTAPSLKTKYLSILEVGGAYAHRFEGLLSFLNVPHLVITDLDSVEPTGNHPTCRGDSPGALTSNASLKKYFGVKTVKQLLSHARESKIDLDKDRCVAFQIGVKVDQDSDSIVMVPRTLEEAFFFENFEILRSGELSIGIDIPYDLEDAYEGIFKRIKSSNFKKTDFALDVLGSETKWVTPSYIVEGLRWLEGRLERVVPVRTLETN